MAEKTTNYKLTKPEMSELFDINVINGNMTIIDGALKEQKDLIDALPSKSYVQDAINNTQTERWTFTLENGSTVTKEVCIR